MATDLVICSACRHEVKPGQRVIRTYEFMAEADGIGRRLGGEDGLNHANCYDVDINDPRYDENDQPIDYSKQPQGYLKQKTVE